MANRRKLKRSHNKVEKQYFNQRARIQALIRKKTAEGYKFFDNALPPIPKKITEGSVRRLKKLTAAELYKKAYRESPETGEVTFYKEDVRARRQAQYSEWLNKQRIKKEKRKADREDRELAQLIRDYEEAKERIRQYEEEFGPIDYYESELDDWVPKQSDNIDDFRATYLEDEIPELDDLVIDNFLDSSGSIVSEKFLDDIEERIEAYEPKDKWSTNFRGVKQKDADNLQRELNAAIAQEGRTTIAKNIEKHAKTLSTMVDLILYSSGKMEHDFKSGRSQVQSWLVQFANLLLDRSLTFEESKRFTGMSEEYETEV